MPSRPGHATWKRAGGIIAELMAAKRLSREGVGRSFVNDCMLAASAQEYGFVLITGNIRSPARGPPHRAARTRPYALQPPPWSRKDRCIRPTTDTAMAMGPYRHAAQGEECP